jgi:hypothetical protein
MSKKFEGKGRGYHPVEELADTLCVAIRTLHREVGDDHIPFFRVRTSTCFDPHQIVKARGFEPRPPCPQVLVARRTAGQ